MATPLVSFGADVGGFVTSTTITGVDVGSGSNRVAVIALGASNVNDDPVSVSVGTDSLTAQGTGIYTDPSGWKFRLFAGVLTVTGTQDITGTWDDGFNVKWIAGCVLPDSALPIGDLTTDEASISSRQPFGTIDSATGDTVVALFFLDSASTFSATSPATALSGTGIGGTGRVHGMYEAGATTVTIDGTVATGPNIWRGFAFNVPASGGGGPLDLTQTSAVAVSTTVTVSGDFATTVPFDMTQTAAVAVGTSIAISGEFAYSSTNLALTQTSPVAVSTSLAFSGDLSYSSAAVTWDLTPPIEQPIAVTIGISGDFSTEIRVPFDIAQTAAVGIATSITLSGDFSYSDVPQETYGIVQKLTGKLTGSLTRGM